MDLFIRVSLLLKGCYFNATSRRSRASRNAARRMSVLDQVIFDKHFLL